MLKGESEIAFRGRLMRYPEGSALFNPPGEASAHKARSITEVTQLFLVEDI